MSTQSMREILDTAERAKPIAKVNGKDAVTFEDYMALASVDNINNMDLGLTKFNADGTPACTNVKRVAINVENFFINRYRMKKKELWLVNDYYCISRQASGQIPFAQVPCYVIVRGDDGKLKLDKVTTVTDKEFLEDFKGSLDRESMTEILPLLTEDTGITKDKLAI